MPPPPVKRLDALTSLRFVAAALIVLWHTHGHFGLPKGLGDGRFPFRVGVSFFFVLSGFILTHVYEGLATWRERGRFLRARFARLWPAHLFAFCLLLPLIGLHEAFARDARLTTLTYLSMVHAWVPLESYYFAYNPPAWSISTEFGFYLLFLLLIPRWKRTWHWKLALIALGTAGLVYLCRHGSVAGHPWLTHVTILGINPLGRLFEFALGMTTALAYRALAPRLRPARPVGTVLELLALAWVVGHQYFVTAGPVWTVTSRWFGVAGACWLIGSGGCFSFAALVLVMALEIGWLSSALKWRPFILLGELSYSVYLLHIVLFTWYWRHHIVLGGPAPLAMLTGYWLILLLTAYVSWSAVERPLRELLTGRWRRARPATPPSRSLTDRLLEPGRGTVAVHLGLWACVVVALLALINRPPVHAADAAEVGSLARQTRPEFRDVSFGDRLLLRGVCLTRHRNSLVVRTVWESRKEQTLNCLLLLRPNVAPPVPPFDGSHPLGPGGRGIPPGAYFIDEARLSPEIYQGASELTIGFWCKDGTTLQPDRGPRDAANWFLRVPIPPG
jgi:peptidoglycan/LPS O-acetylase OafA/YrhL